ncbi:MAG TPA: NADH-quinone oxidoreductase subunit J, partial [Anaerolineaceae bacterium]|nr:NADH-quinone oxidoreductase subunit J [Anaerolineaceae bacterium]
MTAMQIIFLIVAAVTLGAALMIATSRRMMHTVLWLVLTLMGVAVLFALLQANFFSVVQVLVYIGAIAILILFGVMLTRRSMVDAGESLVRKNWWVVAVVIALLFAAIVISIQP